MKAIEFPEVNTRIAKNQPQYKAIPAHIAGIDGEVTMCFELSDEERKQVAETGCIWLSFLTFNRPFQPIFNSCLKPDFK